MAQPRAPPTAGRRPGESQGACNWAGCAADLRGKAPALSWMPKVNSLPLRDSTIARLMDLYAEADPVLAKAFAEGMEIGRVAEPTHRLPHQHQPSSMHQSSPRRCGSTGS